MSGSQAYFDANRAGWDERAAIHARDETGFYGINRLLAGEVLLTPIEAGEIGDVKGLKIAHFQCHIGTDTLSLKRLGAREIVGLDFSPAAVASARDLARRTSLDAAFVQGSVYDAGKLLGNGFDLVFTSWGTITWLDDLDSWAKAAASVLRTGGAFYFADSHPAAHMFEDEGSDGLRLKHDYATPSAEPLQFEDETSYDGSAVALRNTRTFEWNHSASRVINALIGAGFTIDFVNEHEAVPWRMFARLEEGSDRLFRLPPGQPRLPLSWSVRGTRAATSV